MPETLEAQQSRHTACEPTRSPEAARRGSNADPRVLMISCAFPPTGGPGVQRSAKFAKYLPQFGWRPIVWSADVLRQLPADESLSQDLPPDLVHHRRRSLTHASIHAGAADVLRKLPLGATWRGRVVPAVDWRLERTLRWASTFLVPDEFVAWAVVSLVPLLRLIRRERVDVIYSTYSPVSNHLLGAWLKRLTRLPWVSDYRDLWIDDCYYSRRGRLRAALERRIQRRLLERADAVVSVTEGQADILARHVPSQPHKFFTIHNGVDLEDFDKADCRSARWRLHGPEDRFVLTYTGLFSAFRAVGSVVEGLRRFAGWVRERASRFELRIVGSISKDLQATLIDAGIPLSATGYLPHHEAIEQMAAADVLLLLTPSGPNSATYMTAKTYEYLASGRPILAVGPVDGVAQRLVTGWQVGVAAVPDATAMATALERLWRDWKAGCLPTGCGLERIEPYTREHLTGKLAAVFDGVNRAASHEVTKTRRRSEVGPASGAG